MYKTAKEFYHKRNFAKAIELFKQCKPDINVKYFLYVCSIQADFASTQKLNNDVNLKAMIPYLINQAQSEDSESCFI